MKRFDYNCRLGMKISYTLKAWKVNFHLFWILETNKRADAE